ncbi:MAG: hypothetical protein EBV86_01730 [Marivivens sp.]|jgi:hypothetical protein|nr:hypothetical protein [Marivivens sp.]
MNAEKELLLELLLEKYGKKPIIKTDAVVAKTPVKRRRRSYTIHNWSAWEKMTLMDMKRENYTWEAISQKLGIEKKKCEVMHRYLKKQGR